MEAPEFTITHQDGTIYEARSSSNGGIFIRSNNGKWVYMGYRSDFGPQWTFA